jgi:hypothetical protein
MKKTPQTLEKTVGTLRKRTFGALGALRRRYGLSLGLPNGGSMTLRDARAELAPLGISIRKTGRQYTVARKGVAGSPSYASGDLADAVASGRRLALEPDQAIDDIGDESEEGAPPPRYVRMSDDGPESDVDDESLTEGE